jgi:hypothetical protein
LLEFFANLTAITFMAKSQNARKQTKKAPAKSATEKKAAKRAKK